MRLFIFSLLLLPLLAWGNLASSEQDSKLAPAAITSPELRAREGDAASALAPRSLPLPPSLKPKTNIGTDRRASLSGYPSRAILNTPNVLTEAPQRKAEPLPEQGVLLLFSAGILLMWFARKVRLANRRKKASSY